MKTFFTANFQLIVLVFISEPIGSSRIAGELVGARAATSTCSDQAAIPVPSPSTLLTPMSSKTVLKAKKCDLRINIRVFSVVKMKTLYSL